MPPPYIRETRKLTYLLFLESWLGSCASSSTCEADKRARFLGSPPELVHASSSSVAMAVTLIRMRCGVKTVWERHSYLRLAFLLDALGGILLKGRVQSSRCGSGRVRAMLW